MMAMQRHTNDFAVFGYDYDRPIGITIRDYSTPPIWPPLLCSLRLLMQGTRA